jgi:hypothetical protein
MSERMLTVVIAHATIVRVDGLLDGERYVAVSKLLVSKGFISEELSDKIYTTEPLSDELVIVMENDDKSVLRHRSNINFDIKVVVDDDHPDFLKGPS